MIVGISFFYINHSLGYLQAKTLHPTLALMDARKWLMSCICILRLGHDEADVVRLACK